MKKFFKYLFAVLFGIAFFDAIISFILDNNINMVYKSELSETFYTEPGIAIVGASRAIHHYNPQILHDSLNYTAHVYGKGGQNIYYHYVTLKSLFEHVNTKPRLILLELAYIDINNTPNHNTERLNVLYPYYYNERTVREVLDDVIDQKELFILKASGMYRHNSNYLYYLKTGMFGTHSKSLDGYIPLQNMWSKEIKLETINDDLNQVDKKKVAYLEKIIKLCQDNKVPLLFVISPYYTLPGDDVWKADIEKIANKNNIQILDYYHDEYFISHPEWFNEPFHLNETGSKIYTSIIAKNIKDILNRVDLVQ